MNTFYVYDANDEHKFPILGIENQDYDYTPYMSEEEFRVLAAEILEVISRSMPSRQFSIGWENNVNSVHDDN